MRLTEAIEEVPLLPGDERLLHLLLHNLIENAVKFTPKGGHVAVGLRTDGENACVTVRDDGIGIPAEHHDRIFEKFFAVDGSRSRTHGGAGIGLYLPARRRTSTRASSACRAPPAPARPFQVHLPLRPRR